MMSDKTSEEESPGTVLIVEDEPPLAQILDYNLARSGFQTHVAHDGLTACRMAAAHRPDAILLDILLPDLDGFELCRMLKKDQDSDISSIPVIMISALGAQETIDLGLSLGAAAYFTKPYSVKQVVACLHELLKERGQKN